MIFFFFLSLHQSSCFKIFFFLSVVTVDILAVLLNDVLLLLQEKDQKYTFASVVGIGFMFDTFTWSVFEGDSNCRRNKNRNIR